MGQTGRQPFSYTNSKGVTYYLNEKMVALRGGKLQPIRYFTKDLRLENVIYELPEGYAVQENPRNGFLTVKKIEEQDKTSCSDDDCVESGVYDVKENIKTGWEVVVTLIKKQMSGKTRLENG